MICFNPLRGARCDLSLDGLASIEEIRDAICKDQGIERRDLMLLVAPSGQQLKELSSQRVFLYDRNWAQKAVVDDSSIELQDNDLNICMEGANLAIYNLNHNIASVSKLFNKVQLYQSQLHDDVIACDGWLRYYDALQQIPEINANLPDVLDKAAIQRNSESLTELWPQIISKIKSLSVEYEALRNIGVPTILQPKDYNSFQAAQGAFIETLKRLGHIHSTLKERLHRPLTSLNEDLRRADDLKTQVAQVIDIPFLYGVLLIESARRKKWRSDFEPIWQRESQRQAEWRKHYCSGSVGTILERLDRASHLHIFKEEADVKFSIPQKENDVTVDSYLSKLEALNLDDVSRDLRAELGAMKRQLARSMSASLSSLIPASHTAPSPLMGSPQPHTPPPHASLVAAYESRIRKLETILMQSRMGSKTQELDFIRAETRAEARAEARAEVKAEQQEARIQQLEREKAEVTDRLQLYVTGLETILNSMGLQTSRVDLETGSPGVYQVNRVKGLSRKVAPKSLDSNTGSETSEADSTSVTSSKVVESVKVLPKNALRSLPIDRLLEQTSLDSDVLYEAASKRFGDVERLARKLQIENRRFREKDARTERDLRQRVALHSFRSEDLILFLPTRDTQRKPNPWAAFNAGAPHYFLHPRHAEQLENREYLIARASKIEKHVATDDDANIFQLPLGVEWFLISIYGEWGA